MSVSPTMTSCDHPAGGVVPLAVEKSSSIYVICAPAFKEEIARSKARMNLQGSDIDVKKGLIAEEVVRMVFG